MPNGYFSPGKHRSLASSLASRRGGSLGGRPAVGPQHAHAAGAALGDEYVAIRRGADDPRPGEAGGEQVDGKARRNERLLVGPMRDSDEISDGFRRLRRRQLTRRDMTAHARAIGAPIAVGGPALKNAAGRLRQ